MSDIKYIVAGDDGEHTTFPCLDMVRYAMAAAVTMLAIAVIALVIHAVLRSEDVRLSVNNGYIGADKLWERTVVRGADNPLSSLSKVVEPELGSAKPISYRDPESAEAQVEQPETDVFRVPTIEANVGPLPKECSIGCRSRGSSYYRRQPATQVTLQKAKTTNLRVILIANNPGGRTKIDCNGTTVSIIDMQPPNGLIGMVKLGDFTVPPQTTITRQKRLKNANSNYIWENYGGEVRFSVKVQVSANVTSYPLGKPQTKLQSYVCQPVTVGLIDDEVIYATDNVDCGAWAPISAPLGLAPAPVPAP